MPRRIYSKPIASFEYGTRVYAPSESRPTYRVIAKDPNGKRIFLRFSTEAEARQRAREIETSLASSVTLPGRGNAPTTVGQLIDRYLASLGSRSTRYAERQEYLLRCWVRPVLDDHPLRAWTPADSDQVLDQARASLAPATVQNLGAAMRALVTFAFKNRWLPREADPMWKVQYTPKPEHQGEATGFIPRDDLPTDEQCAALFAALAEQGHPDWALAMRLKHRSGLRWGELIALRPCDLTFSPKRSIAVVRAVEQSRKGFAIKTTKNRQRRQTIFPASLCDDLAAWCAERPSDALLFIGTDGGFANRRTVQRFWARAAKAAGWPMQGPMSAIWHPHDMRHVAACWMLYDVGLEAPAVSAMLGHANTAFTLSRYVSVRGDLAATATAATEVW
ncbi:tyrosine-type recombinase/integrase (plasmid) [Iamia sp. SCSIO 61187]|uniref:site-specific integrase n=1 Tax=Iamia sp. SCSIO 61187 TaxID=2722752 RepID=UPI001C62CF82|nr:tyrosine-type recombinase/integrase [Iamia sp. SCSIO 61187]QYG94371.1 tyrosine-type recombinase/integrase [Iamia sp. SCSIO 61187]QYG95814.1 tyrosine-type recombinase/integrase [Iamia sp. SCSIO 61187]